MFAPSDMQLTSPAFGPLGRIPKKHTGEGEDVSPPLAWTAAPRGTRSFAILCHDPDAPLVTNLGYGFVHWVLYNVPGSVTKVAEAETGYTRGANSFGKTGYGGPMPPPNHGLHHYYFWVLAFGEDLDLPPGLSMNDLFAATESSLLGMNRLIGTYSRPS